MPFIDRLVIGLFGRAKSRGVVVEALTHGSWLIDENDRVRNVTTRRSCGFAKAADATTLTNSSPSISPFASSMMRMVLRRRGSTIRSRSIDGHRNFGARRLKKCSKKLNSVCQFFWFVNFPDENKSRDDGAET